MIQMRRDKETLALLASILLLTSVFSFSLYTYMNPSKKVWEVRIFEVEARPGQTYVASYGGGYLRIKGVYEFEEGATYRITYISRRRNWAEKVISIEKIG
jgi:hypothetical protein